MNPGATVFLVDDEPGLLKALRRLLLAEGFAVRAYASAEEFLKAHRAAEAGCLVLDVAMPGIDGLELQQRLALGGSKMPIIFLTGHGDIPMSVRAIKAGAVDFLTKPVNDAQLLTAIRSALSKTEEQNEMTRLHAAIRRICHASTIGKGAEPAAGKCPSDHHDCAACPVPGSAFIR